MQAGQVSSRTSFSLMQAPGKACRTDGTPSQLSRPQPPLADDRDQGRTRADSRSDHPGEVIPGLERVDILEHPGAAEMLRAPVEQPPSRVVAIGPPVADEYTPEQAGTDPFMTHPGPLLMQGFLACCAQNTVFGRGLASPDGAARGG